MSILEKYGLLPDPVIDAYKKDVDWSLIRENLKLTPAERLARLEQHARFAEEVRCAGEEARRRGRSQAQAVFGDFEIRQALRLRLLKKPAWDASTVLIEELGLCRGQVRVDLAVVNGELHGFEIKSDRDSLQRLAGQVALYGKVLDRATLVVGDRHVSAALETLPDWWGVLRIRPTPKKPALESLRRGRRNPAKDPRSLAELLWLDDAIALLEQRNAVVGVRGKPRSVVWDRVCEHYTMDEIAAAVRARLKARSALQAPPRQS